MEEDNGPPPNSKRCANCKGVLWPDFYMLYGDYTGWRMLCLICDNPRMYANKIKELECYKYLLTT